MTRLSKLAPRRHGVRLALGGAAVVIVAFAVASVVTDVPGPPVRRWLGLGEGSLDITCDPSSTVVRSPASPPPGAGAWHSEPELPGPPRSELDAAVIDGRVYLAGGLISDGESLVPVSVDELQLYDSAGRTYVDAPALPTPVDHALAVGYEGDLYVVGGFRDGIPVADTWRLDVEQGTWEELPPLRQARGGLAGDVIEGRLYAVGGAAGTSATGFEDAFATLEVFDFGSETWSFGPDMPTPRHHFTAVELGGELYAVGGRNAESMVLDALERFDPVAGAWERLEPVPPEQAAPTPQAPGGRSS